jgi:hypothetical protein
MQILVRKSEGKKPTERPKHEWEDTTKMYLKVIGLFDVGWRHVALDRDGSWVLVNMAENFMFRKCL